MSRDKLRYLKIVITLEFVHPEFGGRRKKTWEYAFSEALKAQEKYLALLANNEDPYSHFYIDVVEEIIT